MVRKNNCSFYLHWGQYYSSLVINKKKEMAPCYQSTSIISKREWALIYQSLLSRRNSIFGHNLWSKSHLFRDCQALKCEGACSEDYQGKYFQGRWSLQWRNGGSKTIFIILRRRSNYFYSRIEQIYRIKLQGCYIFIFITFSDNDIRTRKRNSRLKHKIVCLR